MPRPPPTPRLEFRSWSEDDVENAIALWGDPRVMQLIDASSQGEATARARLQLETERERTAAVQYWPIFRRDDGAHVGCCGLRPFGDAPGEYELGFHLRFEAWGQGYATEAARSAIAFAFEHLGATLLIAGHHPENEASRRTLSKLGFVFWREQLYPPTGRDHPYYRLTRSG